MPSCRSPRAFLNAFDLTALHHVASGNASMVRPDHLNTLVGMGLVVGMNGRTALTVEGLHALNEEHGAQWDG
jgi:flagellar basal body P-ring protein FlgI